MMKKIIHSIIILFLVMGAGYGQEKLVDIDINPALKQHIKKYPECFQKHAKGTDTLDLPFFDDFAVMSVFPDADKWLDKDVFINNQWVLNPMSYGVASLDIADSLGNIRALSSVGEPSDYLTSVPIDLSYDVADSIYLSFAYQAGGRAKEPEEKDSLVLEFTTPDTTWVNMWSVPGGESDSIFNYVLIPITDSVFLKKGFKFRFFNYGSTVANSPEPSFNSNNDVWNLDYIWLDTERSMNDTLIEDVAFTHNFTSLLKGYEHIPWKHFVPRDSMLMRDSLTFQYRNNGETEIQVDRQFFISDLWGNGSPYSVTNDNENIYEEQFISYTKPFDYVYESDMEDSTWFEVKGVLKTDTVSDRRMFRWNDTIYYHQKFENYYAYDDGLPEAGYGIGGVGTHSAALAYRFAPYQADTLRGVYIYFNKVLNDANQKYFYLTVWDDNGGLPGDTLRKQIGVRPEHIDSLYTYNYYALDTPLYIADTFHVGWIKTTDDMLNVGFDLNRDASNNLHINMFGDWQSSSYKGALMIRPVFSEYEVKLGFDSPDKEQISLKEIQLYPNPATTTVNVIGDAEYDTFEIISSDGRYIQRGLSQEKINVSGLNNGFYIVLFYKNNQIVSRQKLLIGH
ncbi:MAG: T9SS type A sorting domain-containing protein [Bacteroidales bacterium]